MDQIMEGRSYSILEENPSLNHFDIARTRVFMT
uniref:Uncharacterized protein n=1 Tax=Anguilla anguilla TaxID=7936 RepID=A0A0E9TYL4_ANGAN